VRHIHSDPDILNSSVIRILYCFALCAAGVAWR
jgi:hypothetical protein